MGILDEINTQQNPKPVNTVAAIKKEEPKKVESFISNETIEKWVNAPNNVFHEKHVLLVLGSDGSGKSGLVIDHIARKLKENPNEKALVVDLDSGCENLLNFHSDVADRLRVINPIKTIKDEEKGTITIDYVKTLNQVKALVDWMSNKGKDNGFNYFVFDGLSTLLKYCERQMRLDLNIDIEGGVQTRYWLRRNKDFEEILEITKKLPMNSYFIGHEDFILQEDSASIKQKTNALIWQRIICESKKDEKGNNIKIATITKSKSNPIKEGKEYKFMIITEDKVAFNSIKVFAGL